MSHPETENQASTWDILKASWANRAGLGDSKLDATQRQFLPAALEVQESPPTPAAHWLLWLLLSLFFIGIVWAAFGEVDIVVTAPGKVVPSGQVKIVQALNTGSVMAIHIREGQRVEAGQRLISLDPTYADADGLRVQHQLEDIALQLHWRKALETWLADGKGEAAHLEAIEHVSESDLQRADLTYRQQRAEIEARMASLKNELLANQAEQTSVRIEKDRAEATLAVLSERVIAYKTLLDKQYSARVQYLEMLQQKTELMHSIPVFDSRGQQLIGTAQWIVERMAAAAGEIRKQNLMELTRLTTEHAVLEQDFIKAVQHQQQLVIIAPVTGTVQELALHTLGGVVTPAQALLKIVPENAKVEVEAFLLNKDIGFVNEGHSAEIKIDTFNFTKYGLIDAKVSNISDDAVEDPNLGWVFKMQLELEQDGIQVKDKWVKLSPGMSITTEIKTGKRRLIEFFMSPLLRYRQESVRER
ncbi:MAG: hemolysin D [Halioglobus sp.]|jgi:hemolysin D